MVAARNGTQKASWLAIAGVSILFLIVYRSVYYPLLTVGTLLAGTSCAMGWTTLTVGHLNILSATFAVMLIGMGDYGVLWVMRYERERRLGGSVETALRHTAICVGSGTVTAALTAALAFFAAMLADFQAVAELGWIAGSGILWCALACFTVLPAALKLADRRTFSGLPTIDIQAGATWFPGLTRKPQLVVGATLIVAAAMGCLALRVRYDHNLLHLQARDLESVKWESTLIDHTAGASWHAQSYTARPEEALTLKAKYEALPEVSRVVEVASLIPMDQKKKLPLLQEIRTRLANLPERDATIPHLRPSSHDLKTELACLIGQLQPLADTCPQAMLTELRRDLSTLLDRLSDLPSAGLAEERLQRFEERLTCDLATDLRQLRDVAVPEPIVLDNLPLPLRERYVGKTGKWLLQVFGKECLWDFQPLEHFVDQIRSVDPEATGKPFATVEGLKAMKSGFTWAGVYAFCAIIVVLLCDFRDLRRTLLAFSPLGLGLCLALGFMGLLGLPLNPANMIALPLILGVGIDNGVHVLHDYLAQKAEGRCQLSRAIGRGVLVKALTTMIGFGTLMISTQQGLAGLGFCLTLGVTCCMVMALVFLPALLLLCGGQDFKKENRPRRLQESPGELILTLAKPCAATVGR
jgi:uncharacterized protein